MIYLFYEEDNYVSLTYYVEPPTSLKEKPHLVVDKLEAPEDKPGKLSILKADADHYWYEYQDKPKTEEEKLSERLAANEQATADLMMLLGGMQ